MAAADVGADIPPAATSGFSSSPSISTVMDDGVAVSSDPYAAAADIAHTGSSDTGTGSSGAGAGSAALDCPPAVVSHSDHTADALLLPSQHRALLPATCSQEMEEEAVSTEDITGCCVSAHHDDGPEPAIELAAADPVLDTHGQQ